MMLSAKLTWNLCTSDQLLWWLQNDIHAPGTTVYEALEFSAQMRIMDVDKHQLKDFVDQVRTLLSCFAQNSHLLHFSSQCISNRYSDQCRDKHATGMQAFRHTDDVQGFCSCAYQNDSCSTLLTKACTITC